jgi:hypothetical protein
MMSGRHSARSFSVSGRRASPSTRATRNNQRWIVVFVSRSRDFLRPLQSAFVIRCAGHLLASPQVQAVRFANFRYFFPQLGDALFDGPLHRDRLSEDGRGRVSPITRTRFGTSTACLDELLQLRILRLGFLKDRDVGVGVFSESRKVRRTFATAAARPSAPVQRIAGRNAGGRVGSESSKAPVANRAPRKQCRAT